MVRKRTFDSYQPRRSREFNADRRKESNIEIGDTISATGSQLIFRAPSAAKIIKVSLMAETTIAALNESYWSFQIQNLTKGNLAMIASAVTTQNSGQGAITAGVPFELTPDQDFYVDADDVLALIYTKVGSAPNISELSATVEYEIEEGAIGDTTTSSSTTVTTTSSSTTTTTTTTTSTTTTTTTTSSSTTTTSSSTTTTSSSTSTTTTTTTTITTSTTTT